MRMYEINDEHWPSTKNRPRFRTLEEAEAHIDGCARFDREHPEQTGGIPGREYLSIKIIEAVSQPCKVCGGEATNTAEQYARYPYCKNCYYMGSAAEDQHLNDLCSFRTAFPDAYVGVEHTGGGCFWLAFRWEGDGDFYAATAGEAELPEDDAWNDGWGVVCRYTENEDGELDDESFAVIIDADVYGDHGDPTFLTKRQVIAAIKKDRKARIKERVV